MRVFENRGSRTTIGVIAGITVVAGMLAIGVSLGGPRIRPAASSPSSRPPITPAKRSQSASAPATDAVRAYESALKTGKPVYVLFHSNTCTACVSISASLNAVMPAYAGRVVFVDVMSDSATGEELEKLLPYPHIPFSFFIKPGGDLAGSYQGVLDEAALTRRLDTLIEASAD